MIEIDFGMGIGIGRSRDNDDNDEVQQSDHYDAMELKGRFWKERCMGVFCVSSRVHVD